MSTATRSTSTFHLTAVPASDAEETSPGRLQPPTNGRYQVQTKVLIGPDEAAYLISRNAQNNRGLKEFAISRYMRDMMASPTRWRDETGETLKITPDGVMIDGQQRMHAVLRSGTEHRFDVAWNVPDDRILYIDGNTPRTISDDFKFHEVKDRNVSTALVRWVCNWEAGNFMNLARGAPSRAQIRERYLMEPQSFDSATLYGRVCYQRLRMLASAAAMGYWLFSTVDQPAAEKFFDSLISGIDLDRPTNSPVLTVRNRLIAASSRTLNRVEQLVLLIRAWNQWRRGADAPVSGRVSIGRNPLSNENFPKPV
jgi:hypothetical protein